MNWPDKAIPGNYLDGVSAQPQVAYIWLENAYWHIQLVDSEETLITPESTIHIDEAIRNLPRRLRLGNGAVVDIDDIFSFDAMLAAAGRQRGWVERAQRSWRLSTAALLVSALCLAFSYFWGLPWIAARIANLIPMSIERSLGEQSWALMDQQMLSASTLPKERQAALRDAYLRLQGPSAPATELVFRSMRGPPNAFALPGGRLVLTDEMVHLADQLGPQSNEALLGVLAHEQGHIAHRHSLRQIVQASAVTGLVSLWLGDVSTIVAGLPAVILEMKYSRDFETEADNYAIAQLDSKGVDRRPTARLFEALLKQEGGVSSGIFSSHPPTAERAKRYNSGQQN